MGLVVLIHSPFVGPLTWSAVAARLAEEGLAVAVPDLRADAAVRPVWRQHVDRVVAAVGDGARDAWLVAHSGAGPLLPAIDHEVGGALGWVFVDATLPHPSASRLQTMPDGLRERILAAAEAGMAPRWTEWFEPAVLKRVMPDPSLRSAFVADTPEVPLDMLHEPMPDVTIPPERNRIFIQLSEAYAEAAAHAGEAGCTVTRIGSDANHLWPLTHPGEVARTIVAAIRGLGHGT